MSNPKVKELDKKRILDQVARLSEHAHENKWIYDYDDEVDQLVFGEPDMSDDVFLYNLNREINLFLTPDSQLKGIFIEYFARNFIEHNKDLAPVLNAINDKKSDHDIEKDILAKDALEGRLLGQAVNTLIHKDKLVVAVA